MASWFYASEGKQQGPYPEAQFRDLIAQGVVRADTLVWTEGMAAWQKAAEIPGLMPGAGAPPALSQAGSRPVMDAGGPSGNAISADLPIWPLLGRSLLYVIGILLVIPAPWVATSFYRWFASRIQVPERPNLAFNGNVADIWWVFVLMGLLNYVSVYDNRTQLIVVLIEAFLAWMVLRWILGNLSSNGQALPIAFNGSVWAYIGWQLLLALSFITIIGWAWVATAWTRWICRNISGTRREIVFNASGLDVLWRTIVFAIASSFIIPIPWVLRWYAQWFVSQFGVAPRGAALGAY
jgi:hypothetical protein